MLNRQVKEYEYFLCARNRCHKAWELALWLVYPSASASDFDNLVFTRSHKRKRIRPVSNVVPLPCRTQLIELNSTPERQ